ncbi:OLC1v1012628C1 [Oldenlandia corymbosa var. corymbosa]|uniref:OLC1v1012628C1 n=1 Tax=Oldenlandia corymbosa var. corymbosa TaxID=529605 RepID=A0AAV1DZW7_OLDCO|nr:OLC1v1012628C1 [Oldenlandia corymbosa var. corymbosa]
MKDLLSAFDVTQTANRRRENIADKAKDMKDSGDSATNLLISDIGGDLSMECLARYAKVDYDSWVDGVTPNTPRCLFFSGSLSEIAIVTAGGDSKGKILGFAEMYDSNTGMWQPLPSLNTPRKLCSGVVMDKKLYASRRIGLEKKGVDGEVGNPKVLTSCKNELYAAYHEEMLLKKYNKSLNIWTTIGRLPENASSTNDWGSAFRGCGDLIIVIGGPQAMNYGFLDINAWEPKEGPPEWTLLSRKDSKSFVYNCAIMGC